jgi:hypothetical protein
LRRDETGQDLIEYALIAAFAAVAAPAIWSTGFLERAGAVIVRVGEVLLQSIG